VLLGCSRARIVRGGGYVWTGGLAAVPTTGRPLVEPGGPQVRRCWCVLARVERGRRFRV